MEIDTKIGIMILVWCFCAGILQMVPVGKDRGKMALPFWSTLISVSVYLILP